MDNNLNTADITAKVITNVVTKYVGELCVYIKTKITDFDMQERIRFGEAYEIYLQNAKEYNSKIKTILYRNSPKDIYSFYESATLQKNESYIDSADVNNVLACGRKLIITATGGMGKSILMKHLFLNIIQKTQYIPVLIELRELNEFDNNNICILESIYNTIKKLGFNLEKKYFDYSLENGNYVILFDGFDEVKDEISKSVKKQIIDLSEKYNQNYYIISSRPSEEFIGWHNFEELELCPLSKKQILSLINKLEYDKIVKSNFYKALDESLYEKYKSFVSNPLLLLIMLLTFEDRASVPERLNDFYDEAFSTLFHKHDAMKGGFKREIKSGLGYEDFRAVLEYFCFKSFFNSDYEFSQKQVEDYIQQVKNKDILKKDFGILEYLSDLKDSVCMLVNDGLEYRFSHRSFQEYFAALYTVQLDDNTQSELLKEWLGNTPSYYSCLNYLDLLYYIQPQRFIKNVIITAIKDMQKEIGDDENRVLTFLCSAVRVSVINNEKKLSLLVKKRYYQDMIIRMCRIGKYFDKHNEHALINDETKELIQVIEKLRKPSYCGCSLSDLEKNGYEDLMFKVLYWPKEQYKFALNMSKKFDDELKVDKKGLKAMLNYL